MSFIKFRVIPWEAFGDIDEPEPAPAPNTDPEPELLSVKMVAARLGLHHNTVYQGLHTGAIPGLRKVGRAMLVHRATLERWLETGAMPRRLKKRHRKPSR